jgi:hypothetical protein
MKRKKLVLASALLVALVLSLVPGAALADDDKAPAIVELRPEEQVIPVGATTFVRVWVRSVSNFYGIEFTLRFDPALLDGVDVVAGAAFSGLPAGDWMLVRNDFVGDRARFAASLVGHAPLNGDLHVATIRLRGRDVGVSPLVWTHILMANDVGGPIPYVDRDGEIEVGDRLSITGFAHLQGRTDHSGIDVEASGPVVATALTDADGRYTLPGVRSGRYQMLFEFDTYLVTQLRNCDTGAGSEFRPPTVTLLAGDLIRDQVINIQDLTRCAGVFGTADPRGDVNGDGAVNIFDLVLIGVNFGQTGPIVIVC